MRRYSMLCALLLLAGCSKLNPENYAKVEVGMSLAEITAILGEPKRCDDVAGFQSCTWTDDKAEKPGPDATVVTVQFVADRAVMRSGQNLR